MDQIKLTWGEVLERVLQKGLPWQAMDDDQKMSFAKAAKKYIGGTTADGVRLTWVRFGDAVMTTGDAVKSYFARSEAPKTGSRSPDSGTVRSMKALIRKDPKVIGELLKDRPTAQAIVAAAAKADPKAAVQAISKVAPKVVSDAAEEIEYGPPLPPHSGKIKPTPSGDVAMTLIMSKTWVAAKEALRYVQNYEGAIPKASREAIEEDLGTIRAALDFIESRVQAGGPIDWDADLEALLQGN